MLATCRDGIAMGAGRLHKTLTLGDANKSDLVEHLKSL
jgi:hypothetical protein